MSFIENFLGWRLGWYEPARYSHWYGVWHFVALIATASFIVSTCLYFKNKPDANKIRFLRVIAIVMIVLETLRMVYRAYSYHSYIRYEGSCRFNYGEVISFALCTQLVWFSTITLLINRPKWNRYAYNVMFPTNIVAGTLALFVPTSIFNSYYPFYHFATMQTTISHALIMFIPIFLLSTGLYKPQFKDFWISIAFASGFWTIAHISNMIWDRNFMWTTYFDMIPGFENFRFPFTAIPLIALFVLYSLFCFGLAHLITRARRTKQEPALEA